MAIARQDDAHVLRRLAVRGLRGFGGDEMGMGAKLVAPASNELRVPRRLVEEEEEDRLVGQTTRRRPALKACLRSDEVSSRRAISSSLQSRVSM